jgi:hypothetical protein
MAPTCSRNPDVQRLAQVATIFPSVLRLMTMAAPQHLLPCCGNAKQCAVVSPVGSPTAHYFISFRDEIVFNGISDMRECLAQQRHTGHAANAIMRFMKSEVWQQNLLGSNVPVLIKHGEETVNERLIHFSGYGELPYGGESSGTPTGAGAVRRKARPLQADE